MKALILAAGIASRLRPLTENTPKCLLEINERSLLERTLNNLLSNGLKDIVIVTGYLSEQIENFIHIHFPALHCSFIHNDRYASTNNIYSLWLAKTAIGESDFLLLDSDLLFDSKIISMLLDHPAANNLALNRHPLGEEEIKVIVNAQNKVMEISKTCSIENSLGESLGIEKISKTYAKALFAELDEMIENEHLENVFYELAFERLIPKGFVFEAIDTTSVFSMELDTVEDFLTAEQKFTDIHDYD